MKTQTTSQPRLLRAICPWLRYNLSFVHEGQRFTRQDGEDGPVEIWEVVEVDRRDPGNSIVERVG